MAIAITGACSLGLAVVPVSERQVKIESRKKVSKIQLLKSDRPLITQENKIDNGNKTLKTDKQLGFSTATSYGIFQKEPKPISVSTIALNFIKEFEGFSDRAYLDTDGTPVIGYGLSRINGQAVKMGDRISPAQAEAALKAELQTIKQQIKSTVNRELSESQISALASLSYNVGVESVKTSTLVRKLNAGDYIGAANEFLRWDKANVRGALVRLPGLTRRRQAEKQLFLR